MGNYAHASSNNRWFTRNGKLQQKNEDRRHRNQHQLNDSKEVSVSFSDQHELLINALFAEAKNRQRRRQTKLKNTQSSLSLSTPAAPESDARRKSSSFFSALGIFQNKRTKSDGDVDIVDVSLWSIINTPKEPKKKTFKSRLSFLKSFKRQEARTWSETVIYNLGQIWVWPEKDASINKSPKKKTLKSRLSFIKSETQRKQKRNKKNTKMNRDTDADLDSHRIIPVQIKHGKSNKEESTYACGAMDVDVDVDVKEGKDMGTDMPKSKSFLDEHCRLQKDCGKGMEPGESIQAYGSERTMEKLVEKMDLLEEIEPGGRFAFASLTRHPATDIYLPNASSTPSGNGNATKTGDKGAVAAVAETRSMVTVKIGLVTLRYGFLIHWNTKSGLAELIVLRKMCLYTFMKAKPPAPARMLSKSKSKSNGPAPTIQIINSADSNSPLGSRELRLIRSRF